MKSADKPLLGAIEAGGTKFVLAVGYSPTEIVARHEIPTQQPEKTLSAAAQWLGEQGQIAALGIASFGPLDLDKASAQWGRITNTPKPGWANCDVAGFFNDRFAVPIGFDTDVNGAALAEHRFGAGQGSASLAYITVGTGVGGGLVIEGKPVHGAAHPEMGHIFPRRHPQDLDFEGICPHHSDCLEGLASGPAILARSGASLSELPIDHPAHEIIADYLAQLAQSLIAITSVEVIVFGGGVMKTQNLIERVRHKVTDMSAGYFPGNANPTIVAPVLGANAGLSGALILAAEA